MLGRWHGVNGQGFAISESGRRKGHVSVGRSVVRRTRVDRHALRGGRRGGRGHGVTKQALKSDPHLATATHVRQRWHAHRTLIHSFIHKRANPRSRYSDYRFQNAPGF